MKICEYWCDYCKRDITLAGPTPEFRIILDCESIPHANDFVYAVNIKSPLDRAYHFCGLECLEIWLETYKNSPSSE